MTDSVRFIGSGDSFGSGGRFQTCILGDIGGKREHRLREVGVSVVGEIRIERVGISAGLELGA